MRRTASRLTASALAAALLLVAPPDRADAQSAQPPHAWLFGTWTGGLFPTPSGITPEACLSQPVVIFTRDVVLRATLTDQTYEQRLIATARAMPGGFDFTFRPADTGNASANGLFGLTSPPPPGGFGCASADELHVQRISDNQIAFPGCRDFPNPLVRCR